MCVHCFTDSLVNLLLLINIVVGADAGVGGEERMQFMYSICWCKCAPYDAMSILYIFFHSSKPAPIIIAISGKAQICENIYCCCIR